MTALRPRDRLETHDVVNQPPPLADFNAFSDDALLSGAVAHGLARNGADAAGLQRAHLKAFGAEIGAEDAREQGRLANENPPQLRTHDRAGRRIDEAAFHPAYHALMALGFSHGVASRAWTHPDGGHVTHAALMTLMTWADAGVCCPMSMTYAAVPALRASAWSAEEWVPRATAASYDPAVSPAAEKSGAAIGMAMTEKQGGSDVRANATRAEPLAGSADEVLLTGHKWFCSAPMCDAFLTLAYEEAGLSCFLTPRWTPDGARNAIEIQRLKDKLGDRSNASSEIEYRGAWARRVGEPGRGVRAIIEMVHHTRLDCLVGSAALVRIATAHAIKWCEGRRAFQKTLIDQPAMGGVLGDLSVEAHAAYALAFRVAASFDAALAGDAQEAAFSRIATPLAKYWLCKRAPGAVYEAMECLGGGGYVEESGMPRLFRQSPLNAIWEGSGNVIALDVLRALAREPDAFEALTGELDRQAGASPALDALAAWIKDAPQSGALSEAGARLFAERCALALTGAALLETNALAADAFIALRIAAPSHTLGAAAHDLDARPLIDAARVDG